MDQNEILDQRWAKVKDIIATNFPEIVFGFGYGSGVLPQADYKYDPANAPVMDFIFVVEDIGNFLEENYRMNPDHFTGLSRYLGPSFPYFLSKRLFPVLFYPNTDIKLASEASGGVFGEKLTIKYGVVAREDFLRDLVSWDLFSIAGRLHKPVRFLPLKENLGLSQAEMTGLLRFNLECSVTAGMLLNANFEQAAQLGLKKLFLDIIGLSYEGELRSYLKAESKGKKLQIFEGSQGRFAALYSEVLRERFETMGLVCSHSLETRPLAADEEFDQVYVQCLGKEHRVQIQDSLIPSSIVFGINGRAWGLSPKTAAGDTADLIRSGLRRRNLNSSCRIVASSILATSLQKNFWYGLRKLRKGWRI
jgi:hypothetical protein